MAGGVLLGATALAVLVRLWPSGSLRPLGLPAGAVAAAFIIHAFYGREVPSSEILVDASAHIHAVLASLDGLMARL